MSRKRLENYMFTHEHEIRDPIRFKVTVGEWWLKGYADGYQSKPAAPPSSQAPAAAYLRGFEAGQEARKNVEI